MMMPALPTQSFPYQSNSPSNAVADFESPNSRPPLREPPPLPPAADAERGVSITAKVEAATFSLAAGLATVAQAAALSL